MRGGLPIFLGHCSGPTLFLTYLVPKPSCLDLRDHVCLRDHASIVITQASYPRTRLWPSGISTQPKRPVI
jgi:hypothetical protein